MKLDALLDDLIKKGVLGTVCFVGSDFGQNRIFSSNSEIKAVTDHVR